MLSIDSDAQSKRKKAKRDEMAKKRALPFILMVIRGLFTLIGVDCLCFSLRFLLLKREFFLIGSFIKG